MVWALVYLKQMIRGNNEGRRSVLTLSFSVCSLRRWPVGSNSVAVFMEIVSSSDTFNFKTGISECLIFEEEFFMFVYRFTDSEDTRLTNVSKLIGSHAGYTTS